MNIRLSFICVIGAAIIGLLAAGGCAPQYSHVAKPESLWETDYHMCLVEAEYAVVFHHYSTTPAYPQTSEYRKYSPRYRDFIRSCMEAKGYLYEDDPRTLLLGER